MKESYKHSRAVSFFQSPIPTLSVTEMKELEFSIYHFWKSESANIMVFGYYTVMLLLEDILEMFTLPNF